MAKPTAGAESTPTPVHRIVRRFGRETAHRFGSLGFGRWIIAAQWQALDNQRPGLERELAGVGRHRVSDRTLPIAAWGPRTNQRPGDRRRISAAWIEHPI